MPGAPEGKADSATHVTHLNGETVQKLIGHGSLISETMHPNIASNSKYVTKPYAKSRFAVLYIILRFKLLWNHDFKLLLNVSISITLYCLPLAVYSG